MLKSIGKQSGEINIGTVALYAGSRVYETVRSVCPSACLSQHWPTAATSLLQVCCCSPWV